MSQQTFTDVEYSNRRKKTRRESFFHTMDRILPWNEWEAMIKPCYPSGKRGRPPKKIQTMLRMYFIKIWFSLSDEGTEEAVCDSYAMRSFMQLDFIREQVPDATTLMKFRHILERNHLKETIMEDMRSTLASSGFLLRGGTIAEAVLSAVPLQSNRKNSDIH